MKLFLVASNIKQINYDNKDPIHAYNFFQENWWKILEVVITETNHKNLQY